MSNDITAHVITVKFQEQALTEINELSNHFIRAGFVLTLNDDDGKTHDLGTNTFGLLSAQSPEDVRAFKRRSRGSRFRQAGRDRHHHI